MNELIFKHRSYLENLSQSYRRGITDEIVWNERLTGIKGARGVGKTTLLLQHIKEKHGNNKNCLYVTLDDIEFPYKSIIELADDFSKKGGRYLFIDEIHKYPNWSQELKNIYDRFTGLHVVFTGSSILHIHGGKADLSRRAVVYNMRGLSFREYLEIETRKIFNSISLDDLLKKHEEIASDICSKIKPLAYFSDYLRYGYYPFYLQGLQTYHRKLSSIISLTIETDIPFLLNMDVKYINKLKRFLYIIGKSVPFKPNMTKLAESIEMTRQTATVYLNYLKEAEIINLLYPKGHGYSTLIKPEKVYLSHPNLNFSIASENTDTGNLRESFFFNQVSATHTIEAAENGDFFVNDKYTFEVGGKSKTARQIKGIKNAYVVADDIEKGIDRKIPLWLFGFLT